MGDHSNLHSGTLCTFAPDDFSSQIFRNDLVTWARQSDYQIVPMLDFTLGLDKGRTRRQVVCVTWGTQREYSSKSLNIALPMRILVFKR